MASSNRRDRRKAIPLLANAGRGILEELDVPGLFRRQPLHIPDYTHSSLSFGIDGRLALDR
jgi:hypothetical protein